MLVNIEKKQSQVCVNENVKKSIIVSSHERSGTHFLMNSVAINSNYTVNPYLNFDLMPLGDTVNFFSPQNVGNFINKISNSIFRSKNDKIIIFIDINCYSRQNNIPIKSIS